MGTDPLPRFLAALVLFALLSVATDLQADKPVALSGTWSASAMTEQFNIGDWGPKCGQKPQSSGGAPGGTVAISQMGNELTISGAGRSYSTTNCWEQGAGLTRASHSASARGWSNRCTSSPGDPRQAVVITTISATDNTISFGETGTYQFVLEGQNCTASVRRTRSFTLIQREGEAPPPPPPAATPPAATTPPAAAPPPPPPPKEPPVSACTEPGEAARIEVRPARKLMRAGEEFAFRAFVVDAKGCRLELRPSWAMVPPNPKITVDASGNVRVAADAPEGTAEIVVALKGNQVKVSVEVASTERYDTLLAARGLNAKGETDEVAVAVIATGTLGGGRAVGEDTLRKRKLLFLAITGCLAAALAITGVVLLRRSARKRAQAEHEAGMEDDTADEGAAQSVSGQRPAMAIKMACPVCKRDFPAGTANCPHDGSKLVQFSSDAGMRRGPVGGICPTCKRGFEPSVRVCPEHGEILIPASTLRAAKPPVSTGPKGKICPTCGTRYGGEATFCGKDGTTLLLMN